MISPATQGQWGDRDDGDKLFLRALLRNQNLPNQECLIVVHEDADYDVGQWYDKSVVGKAKDLSQLCGLHDSLSNGGIKVSNLRYMGGLHVLLTFRNYPEANDLVRDKQKWSKVFTNLDIWTGQDYDYERILWLKIHGVRAHLWESQVF
ncbi:hypothetical protein L1987_43334 [Smallanthus sonchifolius]|uniref:Uncharacterized protein n=1 Tax=Smallanthus sonchifolius TaxID=185202 RepID=A0ACB9GKT1_9ASTR|nr:hypothetical protein L1987_43334 [Smallanthus sonchifolius]